MQISFTVSKLDCELVIHRKRTTNLPTRGWSQSHVNSISQLAPMYHNVVAQTSQVNLAQLQQQQQQNNQQQPMQSQQYLCFPTNPQANYTQNQYGQPYQQEAYGIAQQQQQQQIPRSGVGSLGQPIGQTAYTVPSIMQSQAHGYGSLPAHILDQIRAYIGSPAPIFILPNNCPSPAAAPAATVTPGPPTVQGCPGVGINCPSAPVYCPPGPPCYPYPMAIPPYGPFVAGNHQNPNKESGQNCGCCSRRYPGSSESHATSYALNEPEDNRHQCHAGNDDTVCTRRNCPSAINLQALASQLLAIQGIIPCAATRLVLRKVAGSNITSSVEETIERAKRSLATLTQEQLLLETRHAQQVNALINLHMTANPPPNVVPILTTIQLKINLLKAHVDSAINRRLSESQGAEGNGALDPVLLALKSDQELRDLLGTLRQKECEERVNLNFAPYQSQRVIAECRLSSLMNKISQVEGEMERRRGAATSVARSLVAQQFSDPGWYGYTGDVSNSSSSGGRPTTAQNYESPDPFGFQVRSPRRLHLQPHVGSPETTYERPKKSSTARSSSGAGKDSDDEDREEGGKRSARDASAENHRCACEKSSEDESADEGKKKLGGKIAAGKDLVSASESDARKKPGVSILKLSRNVVIVIDNPCDGSRGTDYYTGDVEKVVEKKAKTEEKPEISDPERRDETRALNSVGTTVREGDGSTDGVVDKIKKFKWGKKKEKIGDEIAIDRRVVDAPEATRVKEEIETENSYDIGESAGDDGEEKVDDFYRNADGPEPVREQTVRMITKIDYEPSVFRAFLNPVDEPPEKESVIEERFKGSFTEDSLKSTSTESTADSDRTPESISIRAEEFAEASPSSLVIAGNPEHDVATSPVEALGGLETTTEEDKTDQESAPTKDNIFDNPRRIHRSGPSRHNDESEESAGEEDDTSENKEEVPEDASISGPLTTIGNHVASFGSIIGKIAALKLHQVAESSQTLFSDSATNPPNVIDPRVNEAGSSSDAARGNSTKSDGEMKKEIGKWKYIKFAEVDDALSARTSAESSDGEPTYALPKIKHSVIEDKSRGSKYVVIEEPSEELRRELGEPYRTGRSLVIRSRPKSPQSASSEQSRPLTVVKGPKLRDKNCLALHFVSPKSSRKNRSKDTSRDLKSSEKFWFHLETREELPIETNETHELHASGSRAETSKLATNHSVNETKTATADSGTSVNDEHVVEVHEYTKISSASSRKKLLAGAGNTENTKTAVSSIA